MKLIKHISAALISTIDESAKAISTNLPVIGETMYHSTSMVKDAVKTARLESLIENKAEVERIKEESGIKDFSDIEALMVY